MACQDQAWVTLATNDTYGIGALVLSASLRKAGTCRQLAILITSHVTTPMRRLLEQSFDLVKEVNLLDSNDAAHLAVLKRPELGITFTKIHCWTLTQYTKCVFLDADTLVLKNCDELFQREELSAVPDVGWPDCFNSGVFVFVPSVKTFEELVALADREGSYDGGDQGLLNSYFSDWATKDIARHLSFIYNMNSSVFYSYLPAFLKFGHTVKIVHFLGARKPWHYSYNLLTNYVDCGDINYQEHLRVWWNLFMSHVQPRLTPNCAGLAGEMSKLSIRSAEELRNYPVEQILGPEARQFAWERGQIDYLGADAFANIQKKLDAAMEPSALSRLKPVALSSLMETTADEDDDKRPLVAPSQTPDSGSRVRPQSSQPHDHEQHFHIPAFTLSRPLISISAAATTATTATTATATASNIRPAHALSPVPHSLSTTASVQSLTQPFPFLPGVSPYHHHLQILPFPFGLAMAVPTPPRATSSLPSRPSPTPFPFPMRTNTAGLLNVPQQPPLTLGPDNLSISTTNSSFNEIDPDRSRSSASSLTSLPKIDEVIEDVDPNSVVVPFRTFVDAAVNTDLTLTDILYTSRDDLVGGTVRKAFPEDLFLLSPTSLGGRSRHKQKQALLARPSEGTIDARLDVVETPSRSKASDSKETSNTEDRQEQSEDSQNAIVTDGREDPAKKPDGGYCSMT
ncbi:uncharacterized protein LOC111254170 isoform X2 [Varroa destructor]|uniref:glycogenin glucosyltransferase n=1 Tax=Varroa destructor TaxID=109461 RepID=A0A7M7MEH0_VARDE|nr:uncharacterized protein LOC111254170 isoform X2 [Varroa destructor]